MAQTIYKISEYVDWKTNRGSTYYGGSGTAGGGPVPTVDLSNYYTKTNLQVSGEALINWDNIQLAFINSLIEAGGQAQLVNDLADPGINKMYGTNDFGVRGWWDIPAGGGGGGGVGAIPTPVDNQIAIWVNDSYIEGSAGLTYDGNTLDVSGDVHITGGIATGDDFALSSDRNLKEKIKRYKPERMDVIYKQFVMKTDPGQVRYGVIAQEIQKKYPELIRNGSGTLTVSYFDLLIREVAYLKDKVAELEKKLK